MRRRVLRGGGLPPSHLESHADQNNDDRSQQRKKPDFAHTRHLAGRPWNVEAGKQANALWFRQSRKPEVSVAVLNKPPTSIHDLPFPELEATLASAGIKPFHAAAVWSQVYRRGGLLACDPETLAPPIRRWLDVSEFSDCRPECVADIASSDGLTRKFLLKLQDGQTVETVLMGYPGRYTACLSTQAGCAMGCVFCATGQMGFVRHLAPSEIVQQVLHARDSLAGAGLRNLVLMGMGEPLHNYDAVMAALEIISDSRGINIGPSKITISTVGVVPAIIRLAKEKQPYNLAVSLHAATQEERAALVPTARRWELEELIDACRVYCSTSGRRIFFEWTLIAGQNDSVEQAGRVARLLEGLDAHVNLIPLNPTNGFAGSAADSQAAARFQTVLQGAGIPSTVRQRRGIDVAAGCGQLRAAKAQRAGAA